MFPVFIHMGNTWEYDRKKIESDKIQNVLDELNVLGADGWEIISYEEKKPEKFGGKFECVVLIKKRNHARKKNSSG